MARWTVHGLQRGVKEALQGIGLVLTNPHLRKQKFLRIFVSLAILSLILLIVTHLLVTIPLRIVKAVAFVFAGPGGDMTKVDALLDSSKSTIRDMVSYVPVLALLFIRNAYRKPLDDLFMETIHYIDDIGKKKHDKEEATTYTMALVQRSAMYSNKKKEVWPSMKSFVLRTWKKVRLGLVIFLLSLLPVVGRFVFPAAGAYTTFKSLGNTQGIAVGICFVFLPRWATMMLVRALIGMRTLMRELLEPYFARMHMSHKEKLRWFSGRKDVLFGFSAIAYLLIRVPFFGFVGYGVAQAAAGYMLTTVVSVDDILHSGSPTTPLAQVDDVVDLNVSGDDNNEDIDSSKLD
ncbi:hypothetical protein BCR42DRAFT_490357 [Absidia repens]|uniref:Etoposide-induced protein 2.4-domain-containing protein n=1 Tax=Absidia repens TaxID=90262 RepID=A0A1X2IJA4_9FUNG|nr:hypothetical protein BCR42DRAFT_490357 [Absidia repens]